VSQIRVLASAFALLLVSLCAPAQAQTWTVERVQGPAWIQDGTKRTPVEVGVVIGPGVQIITAQGARVKLTGPQGGMMVGPNTSIEMRPGMAGLETTAVQRNGVVEFNLTKHQQPYFSVETPAMAAVVKGTRFVVMVAGPRSDVGVREGVVEVQDFRSGSMATLRAGERAATRQSLSGLLVGGPGALPTIRPGMPRAPLVRPHRVLNAPPVGTAWQIGNDGWATVTTQEGQLAAAKARASGPSGKANGRDNAADGEADASNGRSVAARAAGGKADGGTSSAAANGKAGGAGNSNAGGNGNGNAGGNGNGNAGGNGNGRGNGRGA
jgi:hypothetical protein